MNEKIRRLLALGIVPYLLANGDPQAMPTDLSPANAQEIVEIISDPRPDTPYSVEPAPGTEADDSSEIYDKEGDLPEIDPDLELALPPAMDQPPQALDPAPLPSDTPALQTQPPASATEILWADGYSLGVARAGSSLDLHIPVAFERDGIAQQTHLDGYGLPIAPGLLPDAYGQRIAQTIPWLDIELRPGAFLENGGPLDAQATWQNPVSLVYNAESVGYASFYGLFIPEAVEPGIYSIPLRALWFDLAAGEERACELTASLEVIAADADQALLPIEITGAIEDILSAALPLPEDGADGLDEAGPASVPLHADASANILRVEMDPITLPGGLEGDASFDLPVTLRYAWEESPTQTPQEPPPALLPEGARLAFAMDSFEALPIDPASIPADVPLAIDEATQTATAVLPGLMLKAPVLDEAVPLSPAAAAANELIIDMTSPFPSADAQPFSAPVTFDLTLPTGDGAPAQEIIVYSLLRADAPISTSGFERVMNGTALYNEDENWLVVFTPASFAEAWSFVGNGHLRVSIGHCATDDRQQSGLYNSLSEGCVNSVSGVGTLDMASLLYTLPSSVSSVEIIGSDPFKGENTNLTVGSLGAWQPGAAGQQITLRNIRATGPNTGTLLEGGDITGVSYIFEEVTFEGSRALANGGNGAQVTIRDSYFSGTDAVYNAVEAPTVLLEGTENTLRYTDITSANPIFAHAAGVSILVEEGTAVVLTARRPLLNDTGGSTLTVNGELNATIQGNMFVGAKSLLVGPQGNMPLRRTGTGDLSYIDIGETMQVDGYVKLVISGTPGNHVVKAGSLQIGTSGTLDISGAAGDGKAIVYTTGASTIQGFLHLTHKGGAYGLHHASAEPLTFNAPGKISNFLRGAAGPILRSDGPLVMHSRLDVNNTSGFNISGTDEHAFTVAELDIRESGELYINTSAGPTSAVLHTGGTSTVAGKIGLTHWRGAYGLSHDGDGPFTITPTGDILLHRTGDVVSMRTAGKTLQVDGILTVKNLGATVNDTNTLTTEGGALNVTGPLTIIQDSPGARHAIDGVGDVTVSEGGNLTITQSTGKNAINSTGDVKVLGNGQINITQKVGVDGITATGDILLSGDGRINLIPTITGDAIRGRALAVGGDAQLAIKGATDADGMSGKNAITLAEDMTASGSGVITIVQSSGEDAVSTPGDVTLSEAGRLHITQATGRQGIRARALTMGGSAQLRVAQTTGEMLLSLTGSDTESNFTMNDSAAAQLLQDSGKVLHADGEVRQNGGSLSIQGSGIVPAVYAEKAIRITKGTATISGTHTGAGNIVETSGPVEVLAEGTLAVSVTGGTGGPSGLYAGVLTVDGGVMSVLYKGAGNAIVLRGDAQSEIVNGATFTADRDGDASDGSTILIEGAGVVFFNNPAVATVSRSANGSLMNGGLLTIYTSVLNLYPKNATQPRVYNNNDLKPFTVFGSLPDRTATFRPSTVAGLERVGRGAWPTCEVRLVKMTYSLDLSLADECMKKMIVSQGHAVNLDEAVRGEKVAMASSEGTLLEAVEYDTYGPNMSVSPEYLENFLAIADEGGGTFSLTSAIPFAQEYSYIYLRSQKDGVEVWRYGEPINAPELKFQTLPQALVFAETKPHGEGIIALREDPDYAFDVWCDMYRKDSDTGQNAPVQWQVSLKPLTEMAPVDAASGIANLDGQFVFIKSATERTSIPVGTEMVVFTASSKPGQADAATEVRWAEGLGPAYEVNSGGGEQNTEYGCTVQWTLAVVP